MGCFVVETRTDWCNLSLVVAVVFDVLYTHCLGEAGCLVEITQIWPEVVVLVEILPVALEGRMITLVEEKR